MNKEAPLIVAPDFDDICIDFNSMFAEYNRIFYGTSYTREDIKKYNLSLILNCTFEEFMRRINEFVHSEFHDNIAPVKGAVEAITWLHAQGIQLPVVTARDEGMLSPTFSLIEKYFSGKFTDVHFLYKDKQNVLGEKGEVCEKLCADILLEDALHNALHPSMKSTHVLLFDTPWNQTEDLPKHITRTYGWDHALELIEKWPR